MVDQTAEMDAVFHALANSSRREILGRLAQEDMTVGELADPLPMSLAATSKHIKVLERAGLIRQTVVGRRHVCHLEATPIASAVAWLRFYERHWEGRLDALEALFSSDSTPKENR